MLGAYDATHVYLIPDIVTRWASDGLRSGGRIRDPIGRKTLGAAIASFFKCFASATPDMPYRSASDSTGLDQTSS
jgi:hypothetical protein